MSSLSDPPASSLEPPPAKKPRTEGDDRQDGVTLKPPKFFKGFDATAAPASVKIDFEPGGLVEQVKRWDREGGMKDVSVIFICRECKKAFPSTPKHYEVALKRGVVKDSTNWTRHKKTSAKHLEAVAKNSGVEPKLPPKKAAPPPTAEEEQIPPAELMKCQGMFGLEWCKTNQDAIRSYHMYRSLNDGQHQFCFKLLRGYMIVCNEGCGGPTEMVGKQHATKKRQCKSCGEKRPDNLAKTIKRFHERIQIVSPLLSSTKLLSLYDIQELQNFTRIPKRDFNEQGVELSNLVQLTCNNAQKALKMHRKMTTGPAQGAEKKKKGSKDKEKKMAASASTDWDAVEDGLMCQPTEETKAKSDKNSALLQPNSWNEDPQADAGYAGLDMSIFAPIVAARSDKVATDSGTRGGGDALEKEDQKVPAGTKAPPRENPFAAFAGTHAKSPAAAFHSEWSSTLDSAVAMLHRPPATESPAKRTRMDNIEESDKVLESIQKKIKACEERIQKNREDKNQAMVDSFMRKKNALEEKMLELMDAE